MRHFSFIILCFILFSFLAACTFSDISQKNIVVENTNAIYDKESAIRRLGDSITVDTVIGNFKVFYRVSDVVDTLIVSSSCEEKQSTKEIEKTDKVILLNIQRNDSTSIVAYKTLTIDDFECVISKVKELDYQIESFYLKEVAQNSIIFGAKLCKFDTENCRDIDIFIDKNGSLNFFLLENTYTEY